MSRRGGVCWLQAPLQTSMDLWRAILVRARIWVGGGKNLSSRSMLRSMCPLSKSGTVCSGANTAAQRRPGAGGDNDSAAARLCIVALCTARAALIWSLCECVGNGAAFPVLWEKTLQRKMAGSLQGLLIRPLKVSQSTWECRVLGESGTLSKSMEPSP